MTEINRAVHTPRISSSLTAIQDNDASADSSSVTQPFRSIEALDAYCAQVQTRLIEHAVQRRHLLQEAYDRLTHLLRAAQAVGDIELYHELWQHCLTVRELLNALRLTEAGSEGPLSVTPPDSPLFAEPKHNDLPPPNAVVSATMRVALPDYPPVPSPTPLNSAPGNLPPATPRLPRRAVRPLQDIEADAIQLRMELSTWDIRTSLRHENGILDVPRCLQLRSIACRHRRLEAEAGDTEVAEVTELGNDIATLLQAGDDNNYSIAFDYELEPRPTAFQWGELAERYEEMAKAQAAFLWWTRNDGQLAITTVQPVAEAVAAIQQRFNRLLFRLGTRDPFQQQLFDDLRAWARDAQCYLHSLRPKVPIAELVDRAASLEKVWSIAKECVTRGIGELPLDEQL